MTSSVTPSIAYISIDTTVGHEVTVCSNRAFELLTFQGGRYETTMPQLKSAASQFGGMACAMNSDTLEALWRCQVSSLVFTHIWICMDLPLDMGNELELSK